MASIIGQALGRGVTRSKRRATHWMRKAAEDGDTPSCLRLACRMYTDQPYAREVGHVGESAGVAAPDYPAAADWYRRASDAGHGGAAYNLGSMYTVGRGRAWQIMPATSFFPIVDPRFLSQSASHDVPSNICQALGRGVTRSKRRALQWLRKSAENGHTDACFSLPARSTETSPTPARLGM